MPRTALGRYGYVWVTLVLFVGSLAGHWAFGWGAYVEEQQTHGQPIEAGSYAVVARCDLVRR